MPLQSSLFMYRMLQAEGRPELASTFLAKTTPPPPAPPELRAFIQQTGITGPQTVTPTAPQLPVVSGPPATPWLRYLLIGAIGIGGVLLLRRVLSR